MAKENSKEKIPQILGHIPLFQSLPQDRLAFIGEHCREVHLNKGEHLFHRGDLPHGFYVVVFGQIKLQINSPSGDEKVVEIVPANHSFGEAVMFLQQPYPVTAVALTDALLLHISQETLDKLLLNDPLFSRRMLAGLSLRLRSLIHDVESYSMSSSAQRVIGYLLQLCPESEHDQMSILLPTSKLVIASRLNLTPETLSRVLSDLAHRQLIKVSGRNVEILSLKKLHEFMG